MKPTVALNEKYLSSFIAKNEMDGIAEQVRTAHELLHNKTGLGREFLGWMDLPEEYDRNEFNSIVKAAEKIRSDSDIFVVIGIGGSYMGARAAIEFLHSPYYNNIKKQGPDIYFVGNSISPSQLQEVLALCEDRDVSVNVISKSGTTTEPAIAFRFFRDFMIRKYGKEGAKERIYCTTDREKGTMKELADLEGYQTFVVPDDVGGRYSVLTAVGLLPIAVSGADLEQVMRGAQAARQELSVCDLRKNDCYRYAALRNCFYRKGKAVELLVSYEPGFAMMAEWYKQLFGESEGKDGKGLFPASAIFSTDLHSMGQFIQEGSRVMFETVVNIVKPKHDLFIEATQDNYDELNFLAGRNMSEVNQIAFEATSIAHTFGGVPVVVLEVEQMNEFCFGYLVYFFEKACAISGYLLGVNPFDQPGVEAYKRNMFSLLGKPGYEHARDRLLEELD